jgi:hypothetical protein
MADARADRFEDKRSDAEPYGLTRRSVLQGAIGATALSVAHRPALHAQEQPPTATASARIAVYPQPGSRTAPPGTGISFRGIAPDEIGTGPRGVIVSGAESGDHSGIWLPHSDGNGASFLPDAVFHPGERVTVQTSLNITGSPTGALVFTISRPAPVTVHAAEKDPEDPALIHSFRTRPDLRPPAITVERHDDALADGLVFLGPKRGTGPNGALIVDEQGEPVWFRPVSSAVEEVYDFRTQQYRGEPVLTWWEGISSRGQGYGHLIIANAAYEEIAAIRAGNGYLGADLHEFLISARDTALVLVYHMIEWDLTAVGGGDSYPVIDSIVQEIDIETGAVLMEWHSLEHVALEDSYRTQEDLDPGQSYDYFHINSIAEDADGHLLVSARNTWASYKFDRVTGDLIWTLGGKQSDFEMGDGTETVYQHDIRPWPNNEVTLFDNGASPKVNDFSRGVRLALDLEAETVTLLREYVHPLEILSFSQGNMQVLPNGNVFIGWGDQQWLSEFSAEGDLLQDWILPETVQSYRGYKGEWSGHPAEPPAIVAERASRGEVRVFASWNGATELAEWRVMSADDKSELATSARTGFETVITLTTDTSWIMVEALDAAGKVLATSSTVPITEL